MKSIKKIILIIICISITFSCKKFIEIDAPRNSVVLASAFKSNDMAISTVLGIYQQMASSGSYASGGSNSIATICGLSADELIGYSSVLKPVYEHQLTPQISPTISFWQDMYARIYDANSILESLDVSNGVTPPVKAQLKGEVLFLRAFHYFYLTNMFGQVPLYLSTDYQSNRRSFRSDAVYDQIIKDLKDAELLLDDTYTTVERVRPNKSTVRALLSRVYLYMSDWENAENYSSLIIEKSTIYKLLPLNEIFLSNSLETIWQLMPPSASNTSAGNLLILTNGTVPTSVSLRPDFVDNAFEINDQRRVAWVRNIVANGVTYHYPFKYKIRSSTSVTEYYTILRLAEQRLIRAEAKAQLNKMVEAIDDIDVLRFRAGLSLIKDINPTISKVDLINIIQKERRVELFSEWGDRWFELKRTSKSNVILAPIKANWKSEFVVFPIPKSETDRNTNIVPNPGY